MAAAIPFILMAAGTILSARSSQQQGAQAQANANFEAAQLNEGANTAEGVAQRSANEQRRQARIINSRVQALAAGSGAGATDPTVNEISGNIAKEGELNALTALYNGDTQATNMRLNAAVDKATGASAAQAGRMNSFATVLKGGSSLYDKYSGFQRAPAAGTSPANTGIDGSIDSTRRYSNYA